jgi:15-cis-phytoene synthase
MGTSATPITVSKPLSAAESFAWCEGESRRAASSFLMAFKALRRERYRAMCALYAFSRVTDDLGDGTGLGNGPELGESRGRALDDWQSQLEQALVGESVPHPVFPALVDTVRRFELPPGYLHDIIAGVRGDVGVVDLADEAELSRYCYHVAGAVGLSCIHIWGFRGHEAEPAAIACGEAFQRTNILRDVREDAVTGRFYLPRDLREQYGCEASDLETGTGRERLLGLLDESARRTSPYYERIGPLYDALSFEGRACLSAMRGVYEGVFARIRAQPLAVFSRRVRLCRASKAWTLCRAVAVEACRGWAGVKRG